MQTEENVKHEQLSEMPTNASLSQVLAQTVKTGIIKSNLIPMIAGLTLALYKYALNPLDMWVNILGAIIGSAAVIASAGAFNNVYDRDIDILMERTKKRPTVTGAISVKATLILAIVLAIVGVGALYLATPLAALLGFAGLFLYVVPYTMWTKRRTVYNTEVGSLSGAMPPLIGWAAIEPNILHPAILGLFVITLIWQMPHFYAIAIRKMDDYKAASVPMLPVAKGMRRTYITTNIYLVLLSASCLLLGTLSYGLMLVALLLSIAWLFMNVYGYHKKDPKKWATLLFVYSLIHMTVLFSTVIIYSLIGLYLKLR
ncbi:heme o synthase [Kurthia sibirica]|uniref:Protoheme IX farnesyltransferase n=1 Tax=Kurthia sibirica TaxID=202750 RepID=A0A2U3AND7_9BACL|nr:heme o synthase [Kurthia sibirica]PWI26054.1 protoheme IX farnesyltransferase [Kurthia sibirica]GEK34795.1 protoheme IX farnesyltransferase [Kurthia sibirica]